MTPSVISSESVTSTECVLREARGLVQELHSTLSDTVALDSRLDRDLGLDSLARAELLLRLERQLGVRLPGSVLAEAETLRDIVEAVHATPTRWIAAAGEKRSLSIEAAGEFPTQATTLLDALEWHMSVHPQRLHAVLCGDGDQELRLTYASLHSSARQVATSLRGRGLKGGDRVALMLPTSLFYLTAFIGVMLAGGVPVPIYPPTRPSQIEDHIRRQALILSNAGVIFLITVTQAKGIGSILRARVESLRQVLVTADLEASDPTIQFAVTSSGDLAMLQYTSGSTGQPKGVMLTHANLLANIRAMGAVTKASSADVYVSWLPLYHDMGLIASWLACLYHGIPIVLISPMAFLARAANWLWAIHRYRGTLSGAPNFAYELCAGKIDERDLQGLDLSCWRLAYNGAEPISPKTLARFAARFAKVGFLANAMSPVYGLAECTVCLTCPEPGTGPKVDHIQRDPFITEGKAVKADQDESKCLEFVACGGPLPGHEIRIVSPSGTSLGERQQGLLQFRGPSATSGYFNNQALSRQLIRDSWWDTGDLAYIAEGELYLTGRAKDILIRAGRNIHPQELEQAVGEIAGIRKGCVAAFGSMDPALGTERLILLAETHERDSPRLRQLRQQINDSCVDVMGMAPDDIVLAPPHTVLKTSSGKIRRAACRAWYEAGARTLSARGAWWQWVNMAGMAMVGMGRRRYHDILHGLYGLYSWTVVVILGTITWIAVMLLPALDSRWRFARTMGRLAFRLCAIPYSLSGMSNLRIGGRHVIVANHQSYLDGLLIVATWPEPVRFVAKSELRRNMMIASLLRRLGAQFVTRFDSKQGIEDAHGLARTARVTGSLMFFPEGTTRHGPSLLPFHMGAFIVAAESGLPVLPVILQGTDSVLPDDVWAPRRASLKVIVCEEIPWREAGWVGAVELRQAARDRMLKGDIDMASVGGQVFGEDADAGQTHPDGGSTT